jgi:hypothetical protein
MPPTKLVGGNGVFFSQPCMGSEFQVITIAPVNFAIGVDDASFEFIIP